MYPHWESFKTPLCLPYGIRVSQLELKLSQQFVEMFDRFNKQKFWYPKLKAVENLKLLVKVLLIQIWIPMLKKSLKYSALDRGKKYEMWREEKLGEAAILRRRLRRRGVWLERFSWKTLSLKVMNVLLFLSIFYWNIYIFEKKYTQMSGLRCAAHTSFHFECLVVSPRTVIYPQMSHFPHNDPTPSSFTFILY